MQIELITVVVIFYFYLLVRWQHVRRPCWYLLGAAGIAFALAGRFFNLGSPTRVVWEIFDIIGVLVAFVAAVAACYGEKLPMVDDQKSTTTTTV